MIHGLLARDGSLSHPPHIITDCLGHATQAWVHPPDPDKSLQSLKQAVNGPSGR
jgi:hypothetical protein